MINENNKELIKILYTPYLKNDKEIKINKRKINTQLNEKNNYKQYKRI